MLLVGLRQGAGGAEEAEVAGGAALAGEAERMGAGEAREEGPGGRGSLGGPGLLVLG
jgi:hypothetical protein